MRPRDDYIVALLLDVGADAGIFACVLVAEILLLAGVEIFSVGIELVKHGVYACLHHRFHVDGVDIVGLKLFDDRRKYAYVGHDVRFLAACGGLCRGENRCSDCNRKDYFLHVCVLGGVVETVFRHLVMSVIVLSCQSYSFITTIPHQFISFWA